MSKKKRFFEREEDEGGEEDSQEGTPQDEGSEGDSKEDAPRKEETGKKDAISLTGRLNAKIGAIIAAALIVGIVVGQVALPSLGIGLIALSGAGTGESANLDLIALQAEVQDYLQENIMEPQGFEVEVKSIEPFNELFYIVNFEVSKDGITQDGAVFLTKDGKAIIGNEPLMLDEPIDPLQLQPPTGPPVVGELETFTDSGYEIELQDGKPVIRLFSSTACGHCNWVRDTFEEVANEYVAEGKIVAYHWEVNTGDDALTEEVEAEVPESELAVYREFNPSGTIPTFVFGGKYYRVGVRYRAEDDLDAEAADFRAVIEALLEQASQ